MSNLERGGYTPEASREADTAPQSRVSQIVENTKKGLAAVVVSMVMASGVHAEHPRPTQSTPDGIAHDIQIPGIGEQTAKWKNGELFILKLVYDDGIKEQWVSYDDFVAEDAAYQAKIEENSKKGAQALMETEVGRMILMSSYLEGKKLTKEEIKAGKKGI